MGGMLGPTELLVIIGVALLLFGPGRVAGVGRALGNGIRQFKVGLQDDDAPPQRGISKTAEEKKPSDK
jgi:sec-independent protein translocase protein TatA